MSALTQESVSQFSRAWQTMMRDVPDVSMVDQAGLSTAIMNVPLFILNAAFVSKPVDRAGLDKVLVTAKDATESCGHPWMLLTCDEWTPEGAAEVLAEQGLHPAFVFTGMVTDTLDEPVRPAPRELELRAGLNDKALEVLMDVNALAYGFPVELGRASIKRGLLSNNSYCVAGYVDGVPVSVTATFAVDGRLYVGWVATVPEARGKGYAETVMRRSLADAAVATGLTRTVLHASEAGYPIYRRMGYQDTARFTAYVHGLQMSH